MFRSPMGKFAATCLALPKRVGLLLSATPMQVRLQSYRTAGYSHARPDGRTTHATCGHNSASSVETMVQKAREFAYMFAERRYRPTGVYNTAGAPLVVSDSRPLSVCRASDGDCGSRFKDILRDVCIHRPKTPGRASLPPRGRATRLALCASQDERELYRRTLELLGRTENFAIMIRLRQGVYVATYLRNARLSLRGTSVSRAWASGCI